MEINSEIHWTLYKTNQDYGNNLYRLNLPSHVHQKGLHPVFRSSSLRIHVTMTDYSLGVGKFRSQT